MPLQWQTKFMKGWNEPWTCIWKLCDKNLMSSILELRVQPNDTEWTFVNFNGGPNPKLFLKILLWLFHHFCPFWGPDFYNPEDIIDLKAFAMDCVKLLCVIFVLFVGNLKGKFVIYVYNVMWYVIYTEHFMTITLLINTNFPGKIDSIGIKIFCPFG